MRINTFSLITEECFCAAKTRVMPIFLPVIMLNNKTIHVHIYKLYSGMWLISKIKLLEISF